MARVRMVTRTVQTAVCTVLCADTTTKTMDTYIYDVGGGVTDEKELMKIIKSLHETATHKCVALENVEIRETLYGMPENEFISLAKILPPRTGKAEESEG